MIDVQCRRVEFWLSPPVCFVFDHPGRYSFFRTVMRLQVYPARPYLVLSICLLAFPFLVVAAERPSESLEILEDGAFRNSCPIYADEHDR